MEKLNNMKKNYNSSLEQYKKIRNKNSIDFLDTKNNNNNGKYDIDNKPLSHEEKINDLKKIYQENRDKENELEKYLSLYQEAINKMNNGNNINIDNIRKNILKIIQKQKINNNTYNINEDNNNMKNNGVNNNVNNNINNNINNNLNNEKNEKKNNNNKNEGDSNNDITISKNNPYYTDAEENDPIISKKYTNEQFRQFTYVLFKNFESKNINYERGKNEIVTPLKYLIKIFIIKYLLIKI